MNKMKTETILYEDLGFPITLINVPMKKIFGEWVLEIDLDRLQKSALYALIYKPGSWTGDELHFVRTYLEMTATDFAKVFGVTHGAVLKWEKGERRITPTTEFYMRLYALNQLHAKAKEMQSLYNKINIETLSKRENSEPIEIDASKELRIAI